MDPNMKSEGHTSHNNNFAPTTCGSRPANKIIAAPVKGLRVFVKPCLICNSRSYICPQEGHERSLECSAEIPVCSGCTFKLGRLKMLSEQLEGLQKEFGKMKEEIAFSIVDVVGGSGESAAAGGGPPLHYFRSLPNVTLQRYLEAAEVDTLQRLVFDEWHDKSPAEEDPCESPPQPAQVGRPCTTPPMNPVRPNKIGNGTTSRASSSGNQVFSASCQPPSPRPPVPGRGPQPGRPPKNRRRFPIELPSVNRNPRIPTRSEQRPPEQKKTTTTVFSNTTPETRLAKRGNNGNHFYTPTEAGKRKAEGPTGISNATKKLKRFPGVNDETDLRRGAETFSVVGRRDPDEVGRGSSPPMKLDDDDVDDDEEGGSGIEITILDEGDDDDDQSEEDHTDMEITTSPEDGRRSQGTDGGDSVTSPAGVKAEEIDEEKSLSEYAELVTQEDPADLKADEGQDGGGEEVDDAERQELIAQQVQQQAGGINVTELQKNKDNVYVCMICNKTFTRKYAYRDHLKTHTGEGPRCPVCGRVFAKNYNLVLHLRTHTGEKPFECDVCHSRFADKSNLTVHYRFHTGERPYKCEFCDRAFVNSTRLVVHRRRHTGERPFACEVCGKSFTSSTTLYLHGKTHNKASGGKTMSRNDETDNLT